MKYPDPKQMISPEVFAVTKKNTPYVFELTGVDGRALFYYGSRHSQDPSDSMFEDIRKRFNDFKPDVVFVEGMENLNSLEGKRRAKAIIAARTEQESIIYYGGEVGFALRLAFEQGIDVESPEVLLRDQIAYCISAGFSQEAIFVHFMVQYVVQLQRYPKNVERPTLETYATEELGSLERNTDWGDFEFSLAHFLTAFKEIVGRDFDIDDPLLTDVIDPMPWPAKRDTQIITNDISRATSRCRDEYIMKRIAEVLVDHKKLFIVYGSGHAITQEPALREYVDKLGIDT